MNRPALLLAAGLATRLGNLRKKHAKACLPVRGTTPISALLQTLSQSGVSKVWINVHWKAEEVIETAKASAPSNLKIEFLHESNLLGTGGTLLAVTEREGVLPQLVANAKFLTDFNFSSLDSEQPSMVVHPESSLAVFGGLKINGNSRVVGVRKSGKPRQPSESAAVYTGICVPDPAWIPHLSQAREAGRPPCIIRDGLLPSLQSGVEALAVEHSGEWIELSTPNRLRQANALP